ncbi:MAG: alpha/beta fold hydrolase [Acidobacteria bacterium]|nr:alpha/beta fold hydrolase [Acidobacteriota bacterium]
MRFILPALFLLFSSASQAAEAPPLQRAELGDLRLESGATLLDASLTYRTAGTLNADRSNAILFPTWFTGTAEQLFAFDATGLVDTSRFFLIAVDALANGASSSPSNSSRQPGLDFPAVTIGDMVSAQRRLLTEVLGISHLHAVIGMSMGGMQAFEWITAYPDFMDKAVSIVGTPRLPAYDLLLWNTQLAALELAEQCECQQDEALAVAGLLNQLAVQTPQFLAREFPRERTGELVQQGRAGGAAMNIHDRAAQLRSMLAHDVSRSHGGAMEQAAQVVLADLLVVTSLQDRAVSPEPALEFAELAGADVIELENDCGHTALFCAPPEIRAGISGFLERP